MYYYVIIIIVSIILHFDHLHTFNCHCIYFVMPLEALRECCMFLPAHFHKFNSNLFQQLISCVTTPWRHKLISVGVFLMSSAQWIKSVLTFQVISRLFECLEPGLFVPYNFCGHKFSSFSFNFPLWALEVWGTALSLHLPIFFSFGKTLVQILLYIEACHRAVTRV